MADDFKDPFDAIVDAPFDSALSERYLVYALSTITARSLPDLRDGLKPVHRRLLWAMRQLKLDPNGAFKKSARVVGDVIGKYHPHGDASVYDAMVRLAQDFALRYPLVEGQGNFGNIDGDNAAAYRYTEARLTATAIRLMAGLDEGTVDFLPTYNGEEQEPEIFPGLFPNLLANGASGIAVGMATNIPSHNVAEIVDATLMLIDNPHAEHAQLMEVFHGPDFPTGGVVVDSPAAISAAYETGRGSIRVRGRFSTGRAEDGAWEGSGIERLGSGQWQLVISEIPYMVQKGKLIEQIAALIGDKKLPILEDVRDESDEQIRIVLVPKSRNVDPELLKESLYRLTDLETRFGLNLNVLDSQRTPGVLGLKLLLQEWVVSQIDIMLRRTQHRLDKIAARLELLEGYIIAYLNLDRIIEIIRTEDEPKPVMMAEFGLTDRQAEAILNMRLRSLRKLEEMELRREHDALLAEQDDLNKLLESPARQRTRLKRELAALRKEYGPETALGRRRTTIAEAAPTREFSMDAMIEKEPVTVVLSARGWIRAAKGHLPLDTEFKFKEGDGPAWVLHAQTTDKLLVALDNGRFYTLGADKLPGARGFGEPIRTMVDIDPDAHIMALVVYRPKGQLLLAANTGRGFAAEMDELLAETRKGRGVVSTKPGVSLKIVREIAPEHDHVAVVGENRKLVIFALSEVPILAKGQGVTLQRYRDGGLSDAITLKLEDGLTWAMGGETGRTRVEKDLLPWKVARGAAGRLPPVGFPRDNTF
ncbi:topoisomerase-4 subunit A [Novosphingobium capsulatum]|uniref:DNA topoisomerase 4 subunit A n=1 Tax=Novosphingobium capsulatum TaxID=13688 RepID=A0ABU1MN07_9SPHN|nr:MULTISPECIES: DNA topoisomerase IV subunit A [Novosphingobium]MBB3359621.1 topoisomerase-4 subunit A [Novosphingobium sp. BK256]MBB3376013.1 topoisomerase-4 subunit A [Novosphingobium sp. BK280]MBB3380394.1 topoisomerase-4 subunit A [Novosphingobium sp. BK258]MBB3422046.1 topoisomerase-4 subunit A [Novosphingobium sp. BK267]MBB3450777.1 topoisomerase-4 subunit A [Novosphingobium sp. BK352]